MSDSTQDRGEGMLDKLKGKAKEAFGDATGNDDVKAEGQVDQGKGEAKQGVADVKDKVDDTVKKITNT
jgi:uncharacterized protein YjbJ (UPF0337 family)